MLQSCIQNSALVNSFAYNFRTMCYLRKNSSFFSLSLLAVCLSDFLSFYFYKYLQNVLKFMDVVSVNCKMLCFENEVI